MLTIAKLWVQCQGTNAKRVHTRTNSSAQFRAQVQDLNLVLGHRHCAQILAWVLGF